MVRLSSRFSSIKVRMFHLRCFLHKCIGIILKFQQLINFTLILFLQYILLKDTDDDDGDKHRNKGSPDEATLLVEVLQLTVRGMHLLPSLSHCEAKNQKG